MAQSLRFRVITLSNDSAALQQSGRERGPCSGPRARCLLNAARRACARCKSTRSAAPLTRGASQTRVPEQGTRFASLEFRASLGWVRTTPPVECGACGSRYRPAPVRPVSFDLGFRFPKVVALASRSDSCI